MTLKIKENEPLKNHSTFRIGGPARFFVEAKSIEEIKEAIEFAKNFSLDKGGMRGVKGLPIFVLGGGSNILFSDEGYNGVVIRISNFDIRASDFGLIAGAGTMFGQLISKAAELGFTGFEWGVGIPGTVGGGVAGNCGAYGSAIADNIKSVTVLAENGEVKKYTKEECGFNYRTSKFKNKNNKEIILEVEFELKKEESEIIKNKIKEILSTRVGKIPPYPSAGSVFKNIELGSMNNELREKVLKLIPENIIKGAKLPVGYLIEQCGLKGKKIGGGLITDQHANFIVNAGGATSQDILILIKLCKDEVKARFNIDLEEEIVVL